MTLRAQDYDDSLPELDVADQHKLDATEGFYMLGQLTECAAEVERISPAGWNHPRVLRLATCVYAGMRRFPEALDCVERFMRVAPNDTFGYVMKADLLEFTGKLQEAHDLLRTAVSHFPAHGSTHFQLGRVAAKRELWDEARHWIYRAICIQRSLKIIAVNADALQPIRADIEAMNPGN